MANTAEGKAPYEVTISPDLCCLEIAQNDFDCDVSYHSKITKYRGMGSITDVWDYDRLFSLLVLLCQSMQLRPPKTLHLGQIDRFDNKTGSVSFLFRNLVHVHI